MIKIHLQKVNRGLIFQILEIPEGVRGMKPFKTSGGMSICSLNYPSLTDPDNDTIYLIGDLPAEDCEITVRQYYNNHTRDQQYDRIVRALNEFVQSEAYVDLRYKSAEKDSEHVLTFG